VGVRFLEAVAIIAVFEGAGPGLYRDLLAREQHGAAADDFDADPEIDPGAGPLDEVQEFSDVVSIRDQVDVPEVEIRVLGEQSAE
jgi:hypothetical protein